MARAALEGSEPDNPSLAWYEFAVGLAEYRAGDPSAAEKTLARSRARTGNPLVVVSALSVEAMALQRLGSPAAGLRLDLAGRMMAARLPSPTGSSWPDKLICRALLREAEAVVRYDPIFPADPFTR